MSSLPFFFYFICLRWCVSATLLNVICSPQWFQAIAYFKFFLWNFVVIAFDDFIFAYQWSLGKKEKKNTKSWLHLQLWQRHVNLLSSLWSGRCMVHICQRMMIVHPIIRRSCLICFPGKEQHSGAISCQIHLPVPIIVPYLQLGTITYFFSFINFCGFFHVYLILLDLYPSNNFFPFCSRKLLLLRKRDTVYTRSKHGFSLRKSKVLSVAGSSLKWSKSIERHSKKANEVRLEVKSAKSFFILSSQLFKLLIFTLQTKGVLSLLLSSFLLFHSKQPWQLLQQRERKEISKMLHMPQLGQSLEMALPVSYFMVWSYTL